MVRKGRTGSVTGLLSEPDNDHILKAITTVILRQFSVPMKEIKSGPKENVTKARDLVIGRYDGENRIQTLELRSISVFDQFGR